MSELLAETGALAVASGSTAATAAESGAGAAAAAVPAEAILPGTLSPTVILGTARVMAHGAQKLAMSSMGAMVVAQVAEAYGENGIGYEVTDDAGAVSLIV